MYSFLDSLDPHQTQQNIRPNLYPNAISERILSLFFLSMQMIKKYAKACKEKMETRLNKNIINFAYTFVWSLKTLLFFFLYHLTIHASKKHTQDLHKKICNLLDSQAEFANNILLIATNCCLLCVVCCSFYLSLSRSGFSFLKSSF